jgi:hypothetical protein
MTSLPPYTPSPHVEPGDTVTVAPKNPLASTALWGLLVVLINWRIQKAVQNGTIPDALAPLVGNAAFEVLGYLIGAAMVTWGRWKATRPLGFGAVKETTVK